jgi:voltage-gated potassium channel
MTSSSRPEQWESRAEWPLAGVAVIFLTAFSVQVLAQPRGHLSRLLDTLMFGLYIAFVVDYVVRLALADRRLPRFFRHLLDLAVIALPFLRPLRLLRLVVLVGVLQRAFGDALRGRVVVYTASSAILLVYTSSLGVLQATERASPHANIENFGDTVWWSVTTITTVGYGDFYPMTPMGRVIAVLLMVGGISLSRIRIANPVSTSG